MSARVLCLIWLSSNVVFATTCEQIGKLYGGESQGVLDLAGFEAFVRDNKITSKEDLIEKLAAHETYKQHLANFVLMANSGSTQAASPKKPRVLVYGPDGNFFMTLNGDPADQSVELMQADPSTGALTGKRYLFSNPNPDTSSLPPGHPQAVNCTSCHGDPMRFKWTPYNVWENAVGGMDEVIRKSTPEYRAFQDYLAQAPNNRVYRHFTDLGQVSRRNTPEAPDVRLERRPNTEIGNHISRNNLTQIAAALRETPDHKRYKFALMAILMRCEVPLVNYPNSRRGLLPPDEPYLTQNHPTLEFDLIDETRAMAEKAHQEKMRRMEEFYGGAAGTRALSSDLIDAPLIGRLRFLLEGRGVDLRAWSLTEDAYTFAGDGAHGANKLACHYWEGMQNDPDFAFLKNYMPNFSVANSPPKGACDELAQASAQAFSTGGARGVAGRSRSRDLGKGRGAH